MARSSLQHDLMFETWTNVRTAAFKLALYTAACSVYSLTVHDLRRHTSSYSVCALHVARVAYSLNSSKHA